MAARTPRRTARKATPYKRRTIEKEEETEKVNTSTNLTDLIRYYKEKETVREEYISALKEENEYLRQSPVDSVDYSELTGLSVSRIGSHFHCKHEMEKDGKLSSISFSLEKGPDGYIYTYKSSNNIEELPDYLKKEICFDEDQIKLFFFNVYECIAREE